MGEHARLSLTLPTKAEVWLPLFGNEECYSVSSHGKVRSEDRYKPHRIKGGLIVSRFWPGKLLKPKLDKNGYLHVNISSHHTVCVHRMVAETFIDNPKNLPQVNHKDGYESNNVIDNLEWVTGKDNSIHAVKVLGRITKGAPGKKVYLVDGLIELPFNSSREAADWLGCGRSGVNNALLRNGTCKGFKVIYAG